MNQKLKTETIRYPKHKNLLTFVSIPICLLFIRVVSHQTSMQYRFYSNLDVTEVKIC